MQEDDRKFSELLKQYRTRDGLPQSRVAKSVGINPSHLNRIEHGIRNPPKRSTVLDLCRSLSLTGDECDQLLLSANYSPTRSHEFLGPSTRVELTSPEATDLRRRLDKTLLEIDNPSLSPTKRNALIAAFQGIIAFLSRFNENLEP